MTWADACAALRDFITAQWANGGFATDMPLAFENESADYAAQFVAVSIEGVTAEKSIYGSPGMRSSVQFGVIFMHAFVPTGSGVGTAFAAIDALTSMVELKTISDVIKTEGGAAPSPVAYDERDRDVGRSQPEGQYYRCSGSVSFIVISTV